MPRNLKNRGFLGSWAVGSDTFCSIFSRTVQNTEGLASDLFNWRDRSTSISTRADSVTGRTTVVQMMPFGHRIVLQF